MSLSLSLCGGCGQTLKLSSCRTPSLRTVVILTERKVLSIDKHRLLHVVPQRLTVLGKVAEALGEFFGGHGVLVHRPTEALLVKTDLRVVALDTLFLEDLL